MNLTISFHGKIRNINTFSLKTVPDLKLLSLWLILKLANQS